MFAQLFRRSSAPRAARRRRQHLAVEALEGRQLMSLSPPFQVDSGANAWKFDIVTASTINASSVVVWVQRDILDNGATIGNPYVVAQYYITPGVKLGPQIVVASDAQEPSVAMDNEGDFVVSWTQYGPHNSFVLAQSFNNLSQPITGIVPVGVGTFQQHESSVAMDAFGGFVVAYTRVTNGNNPDVFAKDYYADGALRGVITVAASSQAESNPSIAMDSTGQFDIAYVVQTGSAKFAVDVKRYSRLPDDNYLGFVSLTTGSASDFLPSVSMDTGGDVEVVYRQQFTKADDLIYAQRISATGALGPLVLVGASQMLNEGEASQFSSAFLGYGPDVTYQPNGDDFALTYFEAFQGVEPVIGAAVVGPYYTVTARYTLVDDSDPAVTTLGSGEFLWVFAGASTPTSQSSNSILGEVGTYTSGSSPVLGDRTQSAPEKWLSSGLIQ